jgi:hypothetical protein
MNLTLSLDEALATQLREEASLRQLAPEQVACDILGCALGKLAEEKVWSQVNHRRVELLRKSRDSGLTAEESQELDDLQLAVDQRLEPMDRQLLTTAEQLRQLAEGLPDATKP